MCVSELVRVYVFVRVFACGCATRTASVNGGAVADTGGGGLVFLCMFVCMYVRTGWRGCMCVCVWGIVVRATRLAARTGVEVVIHIGIYRYQCLSTMVEICNEAGNA